MTGTIEELKAQQITLADGDEISSTDVQARVPETWGAEIESRQKNMRVFRNYTKFNDDLLRNPGADVKLPKKAVLDYNKYAPTDIAGDTTAIVPNVEIGLDTVEIKPTEVGVAAKITKQAIEEAFISIMNDTLDEMAWAMSQKEDLDIVAAMVATTAGEEIKFVEADASAAGSYVSGDWTVAQAGAFGSVVAGQWPTEQSNIVPADIIDLGVISYANEVVMSEAGFEGDVLFIHPKQKFDLMNNAQFVETSKAGDSNTFRKGVIGEIYGLEVVMSKNLPKIVVSDGAASTQTGYQALLLDASAGCGFAVKRETTVETKYEPLERMHYAVITGVYKAKRLNDGAIVVINTA